MKSETTIGELAKELGLNPRTIRYYEEIGLLPEARRSESGYRLYLEENMERLRLIKRAKLLGLSLLEIKEIVGYAVDGRCSSLEHRLFSLLEVKLIEVDHRIEELTILRDELGRYRDQLGDRLKSTGQAARRTPTPVPCQCMGEKTPISDS